MKEIFIKMGEVYCEIKKVNRKIDDCLQNCKGFEIFNALYTEKENLWKKYSFFKELYKVKGGC